LADAEPHPSGASCVTHQSDDSSRHKVHAQAGWCCAQCRTSARALLRGHAARRRCPALPQPHAPPTPCGWSTAARYAGHARLGRFPGSQVNPPPPQGRQLRHDDAEHRATGGLGGGRNPALLEMGYARALNRATCEDADLFAIAAAYSYDIAKTHALWTSTSAPPSWPPPPSRVSVGFLCGQSRRQVCGGWKNWLRGI